MLVFRELPLARGVLPGRARSGSAERGEGVRCKVAEQGEQDAGEEAEEDDAGIPRREGDPERLGEVPAGLVLEDACFFVVADGLAPDWRD